MLSGKTVLIADGKNLSAAYLRQRLIDNGATVHVVNTAPAAIRLAGSKRIDVVMIGFSLRDGHELKRTLDQSKISWMLWGSPTDATLVANSIGDVHSAAA